MTIYVPGTLETDQKKLIMSLQQIGPGLDTANSNIATNTANIATNTANIATIQTTYAPLASPAFSGTPTAPTAAGGTNTTQLATCAFVLTNSFLQASPANPTATTSATSVMMGLGSTCKVTPSHSGRLKVDFVFNITDGSAATACFYIGKYGTGTAPSNAAAVTGTSMSSERQTLGISGNATATVTGAISSIITGLTIGTAYWFDIALRTNGGSSGSISNIDFCVYEF